MIEFVACNESQIHTFRHFQALIFVCTTLHAYNLNIFFFSCFQILDVLLQYFLVHIVT